MLNMEDWSYEPCTKEQLISSLDTAGAITSMSIPITSHANLNNFRVHHANSEEYRNILIERKSSVDPQAIIIEQNECFRFAQNPTIDPRTGKKIRDFSIYNYYLTRCKNISLFTGMIDTIERRYDEIHMLQMNDEKHRHVQQNTDNHPLCKRIKETVPIKPETKQKTIQIKQEAVEIKQHTSPKTCKRKRKYVTIEVFIKKEVANNLDIKESDILDPSVQRNKFKKPKYI